VGLHRRISEAIILRQSLINGPTTVQVKTFFLTSQRWVNTLASVLYLLAVGWSAAWKEQSKKSWSLPEERAPPPRKKQNLDDGVSPGDTYSSTGLA
jgi:hypothetical protein